MIKHGVLLACLLAASPGQAMLGTVTPGDAVISCAEAEQLAAENRELFKRAYEGGHVVDPVASELLSWRLLHGPALKKPCVR